MRWHIRHVRTKNYLIDCIEIWGRTLPYLMYPRFCDNGCRSQIVKGSITTLETARCFWSYNWWGKVNRRLGRLRVRSLMKFHPLIVRFSHGAWPWGGRQKKSLSSLVSKYSNVRGLDGRDILFMIPCFWIMSWLIRDLSGLTSSKAAPLWRYIVLHGLWGWTTILPLNYSWSYTVLPIDQ